MKQTCATCLSPKAALTCRACEEPVCKTCVQFVDADRLSFSDLAEERELNGVYCLTCFQAKVAPVIEEYDALMERAKNVNVFFVDQGKETRLIKRSDTKFSIADCADRDETIMRMAFLAAKAGFDTIVDVDLIYEKVRDGSFKIANWKGTATAAKPDPRHLPKPSRFKSPSR